MRTVELFRLSSSALTRHKMRAFLTLLGVIIGVATVVGVVSVISGLNAYVKDKLFGLNPDIVIFTKYGIITSREEWLIATQAPRRHADGHAGRAQECRLCAEVGAEGDRNRPVKYVDRKLSDVDDPGAHGQHDVAPERGHRDRPLFHRQRVRPRGGRRA